METSNSKPNRSSGDTRKYEMQVSFDFTGLSEDILEIKSQLRSLTRTQKHLLELNQTMATRADLAQAINVLNDGIVDALNRVNAAQKSMQEKLDASSTELDFSSELAQLQAATASLSNIAPATPSAPITPELVESVVIAPAEPATNDTPALSSENLTPIPTDNSNSSPPEPIPVAS